MCLTYTEVRQKVSRSRDKEEGARVCGNTRLRVSRISPTPYWDKESAVFALVLHYTEIVRWFPDGRIGVSLNGWNTITTKTRITDYGPGIRVGWYNGGVHAWLDGRVWPGTDTTWFYRAGTQGPMCREDGRDIPPTFPVRAPKPIPKSRDPLTHPCPGDAFSSGPGKNWVCYENGSKERLLKAYLGDHPDDRHLVIVDPYRSDLTLSTLELLVMAGGSWEAIPRFLWSNA